MTLAYIHATLPGMVDGTLAALVARLSSIGVRIAGVVQDVGAGPDRHRCDRDLIEIASGQRLALSQRLGAGSRGCRLDPEAIETAAFHIMRELETRRIGILILNRFGKLEAAGRGFSPVIAAALERGVPVLTGVNDLNLAAFRKFAAGIAEELPDTEQAAFEWFEAMQLAQVS